VLALSRRQTPALDMSAKGLKADLCNSTHVSAFDPKRTLTQSCMHSFVEIHFATGQHGRNSSTMSGLRMTRAFLELRFEAGYEEAREWLHRAAAQYEFQRPCQSAREAKNEAA
jgi:hypothetical protein